MNYLEASISGFVMSELLKHKSKSETINALRVLQTGSRKKDRGHIREKYKRLYEQEIHDQNRFNHVLEEVGKTNKTIGNFVKLGQMFNKL